jgi:hypothetical protein
LEGGEVVSDDYSIGINRGGWYWCAKCGDIKGPCEHFPPLFQAASDLLESLQKLLANAGDGFTSRLECYCGEVMGEDGDLDESAKCLVCKAKTAIRKATEVKS